MSDWLDKALREQPYINDDGFTARVVAELPARRKFAWRRYAILAGLTAVASVVGLFVLPGGEFIVQTLVQLTTAKSLSPSLILPAVLVALGVGACLLPVATER